jgi:hypothetical protein
MPPAKVINKKAGKKAKKVVPARLPKGIKGTEHDPALKPFLKIVEHITVEKNVWAWPARVTSKWILDPNPEDYISVTTTSYDKKEGIVHFSYVFDEKNKDGILKPVPKTGNMALKHIPKWYKVILI